MPPDDPQNTAPESQVSAPESETLGAEVTNEREFENSFTSAADNAPPATPAAKPVAKPAQAAAPPAAQPAAQPAAPPARPAGPPVTTEQWQEAQAEMARLRQMAQVGQRYAQHAPDIDRFLTERQQAAQQQQAEQAKADKFDRANWFKEQWKVPEFTDQMQAAIDRDMVVLDERGLYVPAPGCELLVAPILQGLNDHRQSHSQSVAGLFKGNPFERMYEGIQPAIMDEVNRVLEERFGKYSEQRRVEQTLEQFTAEYDPVLYAADASGNKTFTPEGQKFVEILSQLEELNPEAPQERLLQMAKQFSGLAKSNAGQGAAVAAMPHGSAAPPAPTPAPTPKEVSEERKRAFLDGATSRPGHGTQAGSYVPEGPVLEDQGNLDNFFNQAYAAANAS